MKRLTIAFCTTLIAIFALSFTACNRNVVRYNLVDIDFGNVTVSYYDYNYIEFDFKNSTYELKNKVKTNGIVSTQKGKFLVDAVNYITITNDDVPTLNYLLCPNEVIRFEDDKLIIEGSLSGIGEISMTFKK